MTTGTAGNPVLNICPAASGGNAVVGWPGDPWHDRAPVLPAQELPLFIDGQPRDLGNVVVRRLLPSRARRTVGPVVFFDHMGPTVLPPGRGVDVRPHPHINLATVTYLFEGEILHRDSLGCRQAIQPGAINWMVAGRGIVHSERSDPATIANGSTLHGIQLWVALPVEDEESDPSFDHYPAAALPRIESDALSVRVLVGNAFGSTSPVKTTVPLIYADLQCRPGSFTLDDDAEERALYIASGEVTLLDQPVTAGQMCVVPARTSIEVTCRVGARVMLLGGAALSEPRHMWWNFISTRKERIEAAKHAWKSGEFPRVPGDEVEFIPLPE